MHRSSDELRGIVMHKVTAVEVLDDYELRITFEGEEKRQFDAKPYLNKGVFTRLKDKSTFSSWHTFSGIPYVGRVNWILHPKPSTLNHAPLRIWLPDQPAGQLKHHTLCWPAGCA